MPNMAPLEAERIASNNRHQGIGIALATGCFDVIHRGHVELLERAALHGPLFIGINTDESVRALKGPTRPINKLEDRAYVLSALKCVQVVFLITSVADTIRLLRPSHWIKGGDYTMETLDKNEVAAANEVGAKIVLVPMVVGHSTTGILKKL